jgi:NAD(P)-dependent dehydrogenase (short-subunit alcohol dehydrogenase family)
MIETMHHARRRFDGKVCLVTGGSLGLGLATAHAFVREGILHTNAPDLKAGAAMCKRIRQLTPVRRAGQPSGLAAAVLYLASDEAASITGTAFAVDGGATGIT